MPTNLSERYTSRVVSALGRHIHAVETAGAQDENWIAEYQILEFFANTNKYIEQVEAKNVGHLTLACVRSGHAGELQLKISHRNASHGKNIEQVEATVSCADNVLCSPRRWELVQQFERPFVDGLTGVNETGAVDTSGRILLDGRPVSDLTVKSSYTSDYTLFPAMQRMHTNGLPEESFTMLESMALVRSGQFLAHTGTLNFPNSFSLTEITQKGSGLLLWFWWLDDNGFPVASIREHYAFVLKTFKGRS